MPLILLFQRYSINCGHAELLKKLPSYGLPVKLRDCLADFLPVRKISVAVDGFSSSFHNISAAVSQGQVLAPTLFLLHINDLLFRTTNQIHVIWGAAAPTALSILDAVQRRAIRLIGDPALACHLQPLSHRRAVGDLSLFYRYSNGFCSSELTSIIPPLSKPARCTRGTSSFYPKAVLLHTSRTERYDGTFIPRVSRAWNGLPGDVLDEPAKVGLFKSRVNKLPLT
nr:unnamed protein product [Callosobruchus chinensis]